MEQTHADEHDGQHARSECLTGAFKSRVHQNCAAQRAIVLVRLILFCSWIIPYESCSAVGGQPGTYMSTGTMPITPAHHRVGIVIVTASIGAGIHRDYPPGLCHLIVDFAQCGSHFIAEGAGDNHQIGLPRARTKYHSEAVQIVTRRRSVHHLYGTASQAEAHRPKRTRARPINDCICSCRNEARL